MAGASRPFYCLNIIVNTFIKEELGNTAIVAISFAQHIVTIDRKKTIWTQQLVVNLAQRAASLSSALHPSSFASVPLAARPSFHGFLTQTNRH
jgi:hypothetical protein